MADDPDSHSERVGRKALLVVSCTPWATRDARFAARPALGPRMAVHRVMGAPGSGVVAVRPDGSIGFRCGVADGVPLRAWLAKIGIGAAAEAGSLVA